MTFDHADGASGGCFNLAMYCQGMSGKQMADNWRNYDPFIGAAPNFAGPGEFAHQQSFFTLDSMRQNLFPKWGLDWNKIRAGTRLGTFNLCNFSKKRLEVVTNAGMDEDRLVSAVSLPMWFPPVKINGDLYIDAVYLSDANVAEAIRRGADEIWAIWTVSTRDEWRPGFVEQYFQIIETVADGNFFAMWERINQNNQAIAAGNAGEFGRTITLKLLQAEVPLHYLFNLSRDRMAEAVNLGVDMARAWCRAQGVNLGPPLTPPAPAAPATTLQFSEQMKGFVAPARGFPEGIRSRQVAEQEARRRPDDSRGRRRRAHHRSQSPHGGHRDRRLTVARRQDADRLGRVQPARQHGRSAEEGDALSTVRAAQRRHGAHDRRRQARLERRRHHGHLGRHDDALHVDLQRARPRRPTSRPPIWSRPASSGSACSTSFRR